MDNNQELEEGFKLIKSKKYDQALNFFNKKAEEGISGSYVNAGIIYEHYFSDDTNALKNYKKSAEFKNAKGQYNYGALLYFVNNDVVNSYKFMICSSNQGYDEATYAVENMKLQKLITKDQIEKAKKLSKDCN